MCKFKVGTMHSNPVNYSGLDGIVISALHVRLLEDGSVVNCAVANNIATLNIFKGSKCTIWILPLNHFRVMYANIKSNHHDSFNQDGTKIELNRTGNGISLQMDEQVLHLPIDYAEWLVEQYVDPVAKAIKHKGFKMVGSMEQGGYLCPACGRCNNAYTFEGTCTYCGH